MIFISGNVPSLKNSKKIVSSGIPCKLCYKRPYTKLIASDRTREWFKDTKAQFLAKREQFLEMIQFEPLPYRITFKFVRKSKHKFDYTNALDTVQDQMVDCGWIEDDNADFLLPEILPYEYDKFNSGVYIGVSSC